MAQICGFALVVGKAFLKNQGNNISDRMFHCFLQD
jgi:hypothetical protein